MAYSDYGGYAYRNGQRVIERSDAVLSPDGVKATPGMWPGWVLPEGRHGGSYHALLGDGPIFVSLYKQSTLMFHRLSDDVFPADVCVTPDVAVHSMEWGGKPYRYIETDDFKRSERPCVFEVDGHRITVYWREEDNHYQYAEVVQPDGTKWHGWSGYGVGAGLEDCRYGYSTDDREDVLWSLFARPQTADAVDPQAAR